LGGYGTNGVDGIFAAGTEAAVRRLQSDRALVVDGIVGPQTWAEIDALGD
jgi:peptidoglycan hydrolase-like protein with peptidoglycan-binding domain